MEVLKDLVNKELAQVADRARLAFDQARLTGKLKLSEVSEFEREREAKQRRKLLEDAGIYGRYSHATFAAIEQRGVPAIVRNNFVQVKRYVDDLEWHLKEGTGLILRGHIGTMKTTLAAAVLHAAIEMGRHGFFITMPSLLDTIFTLKERNPEEWVRFENRLRSTVLLVIDDLGAEYPSGWVLNKVDAIISERYNRCLPIIVTTNLTGEQMRATYAERVIDRLRSTCQIITFNGQSLRPTIETAI